MDRIELPEKVAGSEPFQFRVWVQGINIKSGERKWLGFPDVIKIDATESWETHEGTFKLPRFDDPKFRLPHAVSAAIVGIGIWIRVRIWIRIGIRIRVGIGVRVHDVRRQAGRAM